jgi:hypothetical protein
MKKLLMIVLTSLAMAACGDRSNKSEAERDAEETNESTVSTPNATDETSSDTTSTMGDTTAVAPQASPSH